MKTIIIDGVSVPVTVLPARKAKGAFSAQNWSTERRGSGAPAPRPILTASKAARKEARKAARRSEELRQAVEAYKARRLKEAAK